MKNSVGVLPLGEIPELAPKIIAANISTCFNLSAETLPSIDLPDAAIDRRRLQYDAGKLLKSLDSMIFNGCGKVIAVLDQDLFVPIFAYVYGEARQGGDFGLVSLFRLGRNPDGSSPPPWLYYERAAKVALHELGHLFNMFHCEEKKCLMHFSGDMTDLDEVPLYLCRYCSAFLP